MYVNINDKWWLQLPMMPNPGPCRKTETETCEFRHKSASFLSEFVRMMSRWAVQSPCGFVFLCFNLLGDESPARTNDRGLNSAWEKLKNKKPNHIWEPWERRSDGLTVWRPAATAPILSLSQPNQQMHLRLFSVYFNSNKMSDAGAVLRTVAAESDL